MRTRSPILHNFIQDVSNCWLAQFRCFLSYFPTPMLPGEYDITVGLHWIENEEDLKDLEENIVGEYNRFVVEAFQVSSRSQFPVIVPLLKDYNPRNITRCDRRLQISRMVMMSEHGMQGVKSNFDGLAAIHVEMLFRNFIPHPQIVKKV